VRVLEWALIFQKHPIGLIRFLARELTSMSSRWLAWLGSRVVFGAKHAPFRVGLPG
jgi:hypothetical protein